MAHRFTRGNTAATASLKDLIEARDAYHLHLANLPHVVGTALGRYRIRDTDADWLAPTPTPAAVPAGAASAAVAVPPPPRTLANSAVRDWSWPAVLVFVDAWCEPQQLAERPGAAVPPLLHLPDGRQVLTCVVRVAPRTQRLASETMARTGVRRPGPGLQMLAEHQGLTRTGVVSALVSDGETVYALGSRHVSGQCHDVWVLTRDGRQRIGRPGARAVDHVPLEDHYPGVTPGRARLTLDAALIPLERADRWTPRLLGIGAPGEPLDLGPHTLSLGIIGCPVMAMLPGGHRVEGSVQGLFFRHAGLGGQDHVTEYLIGPRPGERAVDTRPGDSGVVWFWDHDVPGERGPGADPQAPLRPLAIQWGGQGWLDAGPATGGEFALAAGFASVCRALDVRLLRDEDSDLGRYWGKVGHYHIGWVACARLKSARARAFFAANAAAIGVSDGDLAAGRLPSATQTSGFIALADVPDLVWRSRRPKDAANHFAAIDQPGAGPYAGRTLLSMWLEDPASRTPQVWTAFHDALDPRSVPRSRGALPFRVAQLHALMVERLQARDLAGYLCAAGVLAHHVGDAAQPLHLSSLHHGDTGTDDDDEVHAVYEDDMLEQCREALMAGVAARLAQAATPRPFKGAAAAADQVMRLMQRTLARLPPTEILATWQAVRGRGQARAMWAVLGERTMDAMADSAVTLAWLWQSAWTEAGADAAGAWTLRALREPVSTAALKALYEDKTFAESRWLAQMTMPG
ncbi:MAG: hypothetical protein RIQ53_3692 [Pseudomonadota bacterium]